jgi:hypothetical protein
MEDIIYALGYDDMHFVTLDLKEFLLLVAEPDLQLRIAGPTECESSSVA